MKNDLMEISELEPKLTCVRYKIMSKYREKLLKEMKASNDPLKTMYMWWEHQIWQLVTKPWYHS